MVIRKLNKRKEKEMKEELAQKEKDKKGNKKEKGGGKSEGEGLLKRQEIPIHHSQFYFSRRKTRTDASLDHLDRLDHLNTRTFAIINELAQLR